MKRFAVIATLVALICFSTIALGGYASTKWGMSEAEVAAIYPEGTRSTLPGGTGYSTIRVISGYNAIVYFNFTNGKLFGVKLLFPQTINPNHITDGSLVEPTRTAMARQIYDALLRDLTEKYGKPGTANVPMGRGWKAGDTQIVLSMKDIPGKSGYSETNLQYVSLVTPKKKKKKDGRFEEI